MIVEPTRDWNVFKQIFVDHWQGFKLFRPRYDTLYYDDLVAKMLGCGNPNKMGYIDYRCLQCGQGKHLVSMNCQSSLCLRCARVYVDNWVSQMSKALHEGVIYRHIQDVSQGPSEPGAEGKSTVSVSGFGELCGQVCGETADLGETD